MRKLPKPRSSTLSPLARASVMLSKIVLTMVSVSFFVRLEILETSSIRSAFVIVDSVILGGVEPRGTLARALRECQPAQGVRSHPRGPSIHQIQEGPKGR